MTSQVNYRFAVTGEVLGVAGKDAFFFAAIVIFLITNTVCSWFIRTLKKVSTTETGSGIRNRYLKADIMVWTKGFAAVLNLFFSLTLIFLALVNMSGNYNIQTLGFYVYLGPLLIVLWFFYLAYILVKRRTPLTDS